MTTATHRRPTAPPGAILLVVLVLLTLFAIVGLSFALYSESEAAASRVKRESVESRKSSEFAEQARSDAAGFLGQLMYGTGDSGQALVSALRGHDMATLMYGSHPTQPNVTAYSGVGSFYDNLPGTYTIPMGYEYTGPRDRRQVVNYTYPGVRPGSSSLPMFLDPEYTGLRQSNTNLTASYTNRTYVGKNAAYTYPDRNNMAVGLLSPPAIDTTTTPNMWYQRVVASSFHRPLLFGDAMNATLTEVGSTRTTNADYVALASNNPNWSRPSGRFKGLRPRPFDQLSQQQQQTLASLAGVAYPFTDALTTGEQQAMVNVMRNPPAGSGLPVPEKQFPFPPVNSDGTVTGDVQNWKLTDGVQRNDSVWLQTNQPVVSWRNKKVTALMAPLIVPLDGRLNLNVAGNLKGTNGTDPVHSSNQGFGPWEQNLAMAMRSGGTYRPDMDARRIIANRHGDNQPGVRNPITNPAQYGAGTEYFDTTKMPNPRNSTVTNFGYAGMPANQYPADHSRIDWDGAGTNAGTTDNTRFPYPTNYQSDPTFQPTQARWGNGGQYPAMAPTADERDRHPAMFNPYTWQDNGTGIGGRTLTGADLFAQLTPYSPKQAVSAAGPGGPVTYTTGRGPAADLAPDTLAGYWNAAKQQRETRPQDLSAVARQRVTPISNSLARPAWGPTYTSYNSFQSRLQNTANPFDPDPNSATFNPYIMPPTDTGAAVASNTMPYRTLPTAPTGSTNPASDFGTAANLAVRGSVMAPGAVDINRPLADYRDPTMLTLPLDPTNISGFYAAWQDRHDLAADIFARLIFATGAYQYTAYNETTRTFDFTSATTEQAHALRWLAQLAVNIVDAVDTDDISTPFVWNTVVPGRVQVNNPALNAAGGEFSTPALIASHVVFGVEKPRTVLNEAYAETVNDASDPNGTTGQFRVRIWAELLNPGNRLTNNGPLGDGTATLHYQTAGYSPYRLHVLRDPTGPMPMPRVAPALSGLMYDPTNVTGDLGTPTVDLTTDFSAAPPAIPMMSPGSQTLPPNNGVRNGPPMAGLASADPGFAVIGPVTGAGGGASEFKPEVPAPMGTPPVTGADQILIAVSDTPAPGSPNTPLSYTMTAPAGVPLPSEHLVVLRRLACPYLPPNDPIHPEFNPGGAPFDATRPANPFITVDYMYRVTARDGVTRLNNMPHTPAPGGPPQAATGRPQPLYAQQVQAQDQSTMSMGSGVRNTLFRHNDSVTEVTDPTSMMPVPRFDWLFHPDRPLINPGELRHLSAVMPHELTHKFTDNIPCPPLGMTATPVTVLPQPNLHRHTAPWYGTPAFPVAMPTQAAAETNLHRAFDALTVKSFIRGVPQGGRVPGKVNANLIWDKEVFRALLDPQLVNEFIDPTANTTALAAQSAIVDTLWNNLFAGGPNARTKYPGTYVMPTTPPPGGTLLIPGTTYDELDAVNPVSNTTVQHTDRPFKGFGAATIPGATPDNAAAPTQWTPATGALPWGSGIDDTLLRREQVGNEYKPLLRYTPGAGAQPIQHPYQESEPLRKLLNQLTTTTDTYLVLLTVAYFEVTDDRPDSNGIVVPKLGAEVFDLNPGDLRATFAGVIDRTHLATTNPLAALAQQPNEPVWFSEVTTAPAATTTPGQAYVRVYASTATATEATFDYDGVPYKVRVNDRVTLGTGSQAETLTVLAIGATVPNLPGPPAMLPAFDATTGTAVLTLSTPTRPHSAGEALAKSVLGNPGPQQRFDPLDPKNRGLVPMWIQLEARP